MHLSVNLLSLALLLSLPLASFPLPTSPNGSLRARQNDIEAPDDSSTVTVDRPHKPRPTHHDRPAYTLPDGTIANSSAGRMGMSSGSSSGDGTEGHKGGRWNKGSTESWTKTWTKTWDASSSGPTGSVDSTYPSGHQEDGDDEITKRSPLPHQGNVRLNSHLSSPKHSRRHHWKNLQRSISQSTLQSDNHRRSLSFTDTINLDSKIAHLILQGRDSHSAKSSVVTINKDKSKSTHYVVSGAPANIRARSIFPRYIRRHASNSISISDNLDENEGENSGKMGMAGTVAIMSHVDNSTTGRKLASLYMDTTSASDNGPFILNASERNATQLYLAPASTANSSDSDDIDNPESLITLQTTINHSLYCATYDPNPPEPEALTMEPCIGRKQPSGGNSDSNVGAGAHKSQTFSYNKESGVIRPMWYVDGSSTTPSVQEDPDSNSDNGDRSSDSSTESSALASSTAAASPGPIPTGGLVSRDSSAPRGGTQNVTLVFVPLTNADDASSMDDDESSVVVTTTITVTASPSQSASSKAFNLNGASSVAFSPAFSVTAAASAEPTSSAAPSPSGSSSSLNVQVISDDPTSSVTESGQPFVSAMETQTTEVISTTMITIPASSLQAAMASSSAPSESSVTAAAEISELASTTPSPSSSIDAEAIASSLASSAAAESASYTSSPPSETMVAVVARKMAAVDTDPYKWMFRADQR